MSSSHDVARIRLDNALLLFDEFVQATIKHPDAATLRGLERRFAERLQIQPSYWSQIKGRSRQIGERLARQFEQLCRKPAGWMDQPHITAGPGVEATPRHAPGQDVGAWSVAAAVTPGDDRLPQDDDERFIVGLVLTYYRRHPHRARARLLDLLGEVLVPPGQSQGADPRPASTRNDGVNPPPPPARPARDPTPGQRAADKAGAPPPGHDDLALWLRAQAGIAPLKKPR